MSDEDTLQRLREQLVDIGLRLDGLEGSLDVLNGNSRTEALYSLQEALVAVGELIALVGEALKEVR